MLGSGPFSGHGFSDSGTKTTNDQAVDLTLSVKRTSSTVGNIFSRLAKVLHLQQGISPALNIFSKLSKVLHINTEHDIELSGNETVPDTDTVDYIQEIADLSPWYRWTFNNTLNDDGYGTSSTPKNGTGSGGIVYTSGGGIIPSLSWESIDLTPDDEVRIADSPKINTGSGYTFVKRSISVWATFDSVSGTDGNGRVIWEQGGTGQWWSIYLHDSNLYTCIGESNSQKGHCSSPVSASTLYLITVTIDLSLSSNQMKLYINGSLVSEATTSAGSSLSSHGGNIAWGGPNSSPRNHLNESITANVDARLADGCYWYEEVLTPTEISNIWSAGN